LGQAHVARDDRIEHQLAQAFADIVGDLVGQPVAAVEHRQDDTDDAKIGVEALLDLLDRLEKLAQPLQREELALQRDEQRIGGRQRVQRQQAERRRAVDEADVMPAMAFERAPQAARALIDTHQLDLGTAEVDRGGHDIEAGDRARHRAAVDRHPVDQQVVARALALPGRDAQPGRSVALRLEVDQQGLPSGGSHGRGDVDGGGGLPNSTFLIGDGDPDLGSFGTPLPTKIPPPGSVWDCSTWNICRIACGCSDSSCAAERPLGNSQAVVRVEKRADKLSSLPSGAKARAVMTPASKLSTLSSRAPTTRHFTSPSSAAARTSHSTLRLRDSTSTISTSGCAIASTSPGKPAPLPRSSQGPVP